MALFIGLPILAHPLALRVAVLLISFILSLLFYRLGQKWVFRVVLLVYLGGIIILFIYVAILRIEDKMDLNYKIGLGVFVLLLLLNISGVKVRSRPSREVSLAEFRKFSDLYNQINLGLLILLIRYLLLTLFCVVKITEGFKGTIVKSLSV